MFVNYHYTEVFSHNALHLVVS